MVNNLAGVIIWTQRLKPMVHFYANVLGLPLHSNRPEFVAFKWGALRLSIGLHKAVTGLAKDPYRIMVNLETRDIFGLYFHLKSKGIMFIRPPEQERWGGWVATFKDPDGNILQLLQHPDGNYKTVTYECSDIDR